MKRIDYLCEITAGITTALQTNEILQIVQLVLTLISVLVSLSFTISKWFKEAKKDGVITADEIKDGISVITNEIINNFSLLKSKSEESTSEEEKVSTAEVVESASENTAENTSESIIKDNNSDILKDVNSDIIVENTDDED